MLFAGFWQVDRHRSRAVRNDTIAARALEAPVPIGEVAPPTAAVEVGQQRQFQRVVATGEYQISDEVLIRNRTFEGAPGYWVLTPLVTDEGWAVTVNRGWISIAYEPDAPRPDIVAPQGRVTVTGTVQPARTAEGFQQSDPQSGRLTSLARADVARLAQQVDYPLSPVVLQVDAPEQPGATQPFALALPALDSGPHFSYAAQWFIFSAIAIIGYPLVLRRVALGKATSVPEYDDV